MAKMLLAVNLTPVPPSLLPHLLPHLSSPSGLLPRVHYVRIFRRVATQAQPRMLAAPLQSTSAFNDHTDIGTQYRPAKDLQAFNALLPPPIEFVKGSSTGTIAPGDGKYPPINAAPDEEKTNVSPLGISRRVSAFRSIVWGFLGRGVSPGISNRASAQFE